VLRNYYITLNIEYNNSINDLNQTKMKTLALAVLLLTGTFLSVHSQAQGTMKNEKTVMVGGAAMYPSKDIIANAVNSKDHTTLVAAVKAAGLVETLQGAGPFTVFAPTNAAFEKLPAGTVDNLLKEENKPALTGVLTYHVVAGTLGSNELMQGIKKGNGSYELTTVAGGKLWIMQKGNSLSLKDEKGNLANVTIKDVNQSNGVIHVIDTVLMPK
jgi:uncharacterized surface protein with fasciclin (FAS1) repeats